MAWHSKKGPPAASGIVVLVVFFFLSFQLSSDLPKWPAQHYASKSGAYAVSSKYVVMDDGRPPLSQLIGDTDKNITGDVQFLLDFIIAGHPKTATSSCMCWLSKHPQVQMHRKEINAIHNGKPAELVEILYNMPQGRHYKRGYVAPNDIRLQQSLKAIHTYFPKTALIVGLRHPILWMQSFYNFMGRKGKLKTMLPLEQMVGKHLKREVLYHNNLSQLGKTNIMNSNEAKLLEMNRFFGKPRTEPFPYMSNKIFLYDIVQFGDYKNASRYAQFRTDLTKFLGLTQPLVPWNSSCESQTFDEDFVEIDICHAQYRQVRSDLLQMGRRASEWILTYLLPHPDVVVSNDEHFRASLLTWLDDPCH
jgi:hypothetical protein